MNTSTSTAFRMSNRESFQQQETAAMCRIPGMRELLAASEDERPSLGKKYPDAAFALKIISNPFVPDRELGAIQLEAYSAILNGEPISGVHYRYDRQIDAYLTRHNWD